MFMGVLLPCMFVYHVCAVFKEVTVDSWDWSYEMIVICCHMGAGKSNQCSQLLSHLSSPTYYYFNH